MKMGREFPLRNSWSNVCKGCIERCSTVSIQNSSSMHIPYQSNLVLGDMRLSDNLDGVNKPRQTAPDLPEAPQIHSLRQTRETPISWSSRVMNGNQE